MHQALQTSYRSDNQCTVQIKVLPNPEVHRERVLEHIAELESFGIIEKAAIQYVNPLVGVVKKTGDIRLCLDARELNKRMVNDHAQPPTIDEVFRKIGHKKYFSTLLLKKDRMKVHVDKPGTNGVRRD